jgi:hypothetical protein
MKMDLREVLCEGRMLDGPGSEPYSMTSFDFSSV